MTLTTDHRPPTTVSIVGDRLSVHFDRFDIESYPLFMKVKALPEWNIEHERDTETYRITAPARFASLLGMPAVAPPKTPLPLPAWMFDDQQAILRMFLEHKRFAAWLDCGLGKTPIGLEAMRQVHHLTGGRCLVLTLNEIVPQWIEEAQKFYGDELKLFRIETREQMKAFCRGDLPEAGPYAIVNYEKLNWKRGGSNDGGEADSDGEVVNEFRHLALLVPDEAQRLNTPGGRQKWALIKSARGIEYKLGLTATPAPNNMAEFSSQASFLEKLVNEDEIMWTYFRRDEVTHRWDIKPHARQAFIEFLAGWSIYVRDPRRYGWRKDWAGVPPYELITHELPITSEQMEWLQKLSRDPRGQMSFVDRQRNAIERNKLAQVARGFIYRKDRHGKRVARSIESIKPGFVADLIRQEAAAGLQTLTWTVFNAESKRIAKELKAQGFRDFAMLHGDTPEKERLEILDAFRHGSVPHLISKEKLLGYGMNFQFCRSMIFSGFNDSYVAWYQAIRRAVRYGQEFSVRVHMPLIPELEGDMWENLLIKQAENEATLAEFEKHFIQTLGRYAA